jgi:hypothetical protein
VLLSCRMLNAVSDVNHWDLVETLEMSEGSLPSDIYLMLVDESLDRFASGFSPDGRRYCPPAGSTLTVTLDNVDDAKKVTRVATQPFPGDASIWKVSLLTTDSGKVRGTVNVKLSLAETTPVARTITGSVKAAIGVRSL